MGNDIRIKILSNDGSAVEDEAVSIIAPGGLGYLGVLKNHAPLVSMSNPGKFTLRRSDGSTRTLELGSGLLEVTHNQVTFLVDRLTESALEPEASFAIS